MRLHLPACTVSLAVGLLLTASCNRPTSTPEESQTPAETQAAKEPQVPPDLQAVVDQLVKSFEALDEAKALEVYADDFQSGTGRAKEDLGKMLNQLKSHKVALTIENAKLQEVKLTEATLKTQLRLRYEDRFRGLKGEVVVTDVLLHSLRKEGEQWKIYADERIATYRDGRFGNQPPNVEIELPSEVPRSLDYPVKITVRRDKDIAYQVLIGNYVDDSGVLPPDIVTPLPEDGVLQKNLLPNPKGLSEMVKVTIIAANPQGEWMGATMVSKFVHGATRKKAAEPKQAT